MARLSFSAIGTTWSIATTSSVSKETWKRLEATITATIESFDQSFSRFRADSWVTSVSKQAGTFLLQPHGFELLAFYEQLYRATDGLVTPLIGQVMEGAGYDAEYSLRSRKLTTPPGWDDVLRFDETQLTTTRPALLDFGAAGKGYLVDIVAGLLADAGLRSYVIDAGGDICQRSETHKTLTIGLENPYDTTEVIGKLELANRSLAASAGSRRAWETFHHIINPRTLESPREVAATWVTAADTMTADGVATALFFVPASILQRYFSFEYVVLRRDMSVAYSPDLAVQLNEVASV